MSTAPFSLSLGQCATLACLWEASAAKPGNVHRGADFDDVTYIDYVVSGALLGPVFDRAGELSCGELIQQAVHAIAQSVGRNTYLGTILLLGPLAKAATARAQLGDWTPAVAEALQHLDERDARHVYEAIRLAQPGGLGTVPEHDVRDAPGHDLRAAMQLAADRDLVARQYVTDFRDVLTVVVPRLRQATGELPALNDAIVRVQLEVLSQFPDSLISRKCGAATAQQASDRAAKALAAGGPRDESYAHALADFDFWLRSDGHRRNPGTTADLLAASLFVLLASGELHPPRPFYALAGK